MKYDIIFTNGKIFTSDTEKPYAEAMAVKNGRIAFIGSMEELKGEAGSDLSSCADKVCDLGGKRMLPGLIDSHMHPVMIADNMSQIVCLPPYIHSIEEMIPAIAAKRAGRRKSRAQCREHTHKREKGKITSFFDRNKQEMLFGTVLTAGEGVRAKGGAFPLMRRRMPRIRRIFYKKGEKFAQIFPPTVCLPKYSTFLRL